MTDRNPSFENAAAANCGRGEETFEVDAKLLDQAKFVKLYKH